jgi:HlyD family secretion protein
MVESKKQPKRIWIVWVAVASVLGIAGFAAMKRSAANSAGIPTGVETAKAEIGDQQQKINATGVVASQIGTQIKIGSQVTGRILRLPADVGTHVRAGQIVAVLDSPDIQAQVDQQQANVAVAEASLAQSKSRLQQAEETAGFTHQQTTAQIAEADAALRAAEAKVESSVATARYQPTQTAANIRRSEAALSTAQSAVKQQQQTIRQEIQQAQSSLDNAQAAADNTKREADRQQKLLKQGFVAQSLADNAETASRQATANLESMKANLDIVREKTRADLQATMDQVDQAQASLTATQAGRFQDSVAEADLKSARQTLRQSSAALDLQKTNRTQDRIRLMAVEEARNAMRQAQESVLASRALLRYQNAQRDKTVIHSPIDGTVLSITAQQGETIAAGLAAPTLITVADLDRLEVRAYVDETDIGRIRVKMETEVRVDAFAGRAFHGKVTKIASASTVKDNVVTYETTVAVANPDRSLRPDMTTNVAFILGRRNHVLLVPSEAVHQETTRSVVYVLHAERKGAERVEIRTVDAGFDDGAHTEIRSGLKPGETVVLTGLPLLGMHASDAPGGGPR